jgi:hypothetical protein
MELGIDSNERAMVTVILARRMTLRMERDMLEAGILLLKEIAKRMCLVRVAVEQET